LPINTDSWDDESDWDGDKEAKPESAPVYLPSTKSAMIPKGKKSPPMTPKVAAVEPSSFTVEELIAEQQKNSYAPAITSLSLSKSKSAAAKRQRNLMTTSLHPWGWLLFHPRGV
jgi:hypothetical protein